MENTLSLLNYSLLVSYIIFTSCKSTKTKSDSEQLELVKKNLTLKTVEGKNVELKNIQGTLDLHESSKFGVKVTWSSAEKEYFDIKRGIITHPEKTKAFKLTAHITNGELKEVKEFKVILNPLFYDGELEPAFDRYRWWKDHLSWPQIKNIRRNHFDPGVIKYEDKIQLYEMMKEKGLPIPEIYFETRNPENFVDKLKNLDSYVAKASHFSDSQRVVVIKMELILRIDKLLLLIRCKKVCIRILRKK